MEGSGDLSVKHKAHWSHFQARQGRGAKLKAQNQLLCLLFFKAVGVYCRQTAFYGRHPSGYKILFNL